MIVYMAHPVRPIEGETLAGNIELAHEWLRWCHERFTAWVVIAPWLAELHAYGLDEEGERKQREAGMARQLEVVRRGCDAVLLTGSRISTGMRDEARAKLMAMGRVFYLPQQAARPGDLHPLYGATVLDYTSAGGRGFLGRMPQELRETEVRR